MNSCETNYAAINATIMIILRNFARTAAVMNGDVRAAFTLTARRKPVFVIIQRSFSTTFIVMSKMIKLIKLRYPPVTPRLG